MPPTTSSVPAIPNNVSVATGRLDHTNAGSVDSNLWFILGHAFQYRLHPDLEFLSAEWPVLGKPALVRYRIPNGWAARSDEPPIRPARQPLQRSL
jgi:hypothetical protein